MKQGERPTKPNQLERLYVGLLLVIFGGIVLHAPLTVVFGVMFPDAALFIKSWKEVLMLVASGLLFVILSRRKSLTLFRDPLLIAIGVYGAIHLIVLIFMWQGLLPSLAGLLIDLRYLLFFVLVYIALQLFPDKKQLFIKVVAVGALVVSIFAVIQVTVLPADALKYIGYSNQTIAPYLTVDENPDYVRISSTLRGPNPLGAYAVIVIAAITAYVAKGRLGKKSRNQIATGILAAGSLVALWASYSRSALAAAGVAVAVVLGATVGRKLSRKWWIVICIVLVALAVGLVAARGTDAVSNILLHENTDGGAAVNSNEGHVSSIQESLSAVASHPLGAGIGSTGSASLLGSGQSMIIENQYLFVAHEVGWFGLVLFLLIWVGVLSRLWQHRRDWLALSTLASGIGLALIGLLLPVWVDDTVSIIWWGLAAIALSHRVHDRKVNHG